MKKFYMLMLGVGIALTVQAQRVKFYYDGAEVTQGSTLVSNEVIDDGFSYTFKPAVTLQASSNSQVVVKVECTTGQDVGLCFGSLCLAPAPTLTSNPFQMAANTPYPLEYDYEAFEPINVEVTSNIEVRDYVTDAVLNNIIISYKPNGGGVSIASAENEISYDGSALNYNVGEAKALVVSNVQGQMVVDAVVSGTGSIDVSTLAKGMYVYRLGKTGGKLIVK